MDVGKLRLIYRGVRSRTVVPGVSGRDIALAALIWRTGPWFIVVMAWMHGMWVVVVGVGVLGLMLVARSPLQRNFHANPCGTCTT